jgi:thiol peroxidase
MDRKGAVTFKGNPMTLTGNGQKTGNKAPDFTVIGKDLKPVTLKDFSGKTKLISVHLARHPSLRHRPGGSHEAAKLPAEVAV